MATNRYFTKRINGLFKVQVPVDIVYEILLGLPTKLLLHFQSISKSRRDITDDNLRFAYMHMSTRLLAATDADEPQLLPM